MAGLSTGTPIVQVYHEKSRILPDVARVLACLYEKDIKFDTHTSSYKSLLKLQASTHAPVPFYDGLTFLEDYREICRYIAKKYKHHGYPFLLGKDTLERASVEQWLHNEEHAFNPPSRALFCHLAFPTDKDDNGDDINMHTRKLEEVLEVYEQRLSDNEFLSGNKFTLADLVHLPNSHYITESEFVYLYDSRKNVRRWWDAISTRDSWQQVLIDMRRVEEQNQQEELKKQQQQKNHPRTPDYPVRIPRMQTTTEPRTVLMHPAGTVSSSPIAPQTKPLRIDIPNGALISSSQSTPADHRISVAQNKETPSQEKPPQKSPIPVQSTIAPAVFPTTSEEPPTDGAASLSTKEDSSKDASKQPRGTASTPRRKAAQDDNDTSEGSTIADEVASTKQPSNAQRAPISPRRQDFEYSPVEITSFQKRHPYVEDMEVADTFEEKKIADSSLTSAKPMYPRQSVPPRRQVEVQHGQEKGRQSEVMSPKPQKVVSRDARYTHGERKTSTPAEQSSELLQAIPQPRPVAAEGAHGATSETIQFPDIRDTTKKSRGTFEESQDAGPAPTLPRERPLGARDAPESKTPAADHQRKDVSTQLESDAVPQPKLPAADQRGLGSLSSNERDVKDLHAKLSEGNRVPSEQLREKIRKSQPTGPRAHHIESQGSVKVEKVPFLYQKKPLFAQDSQDKALIIPSGGKGDDYTPDHEEASDAPYDFDEKLSATASARAKSHDDFSAEKRHIKGTTDDQKVVSPLRSKESASQVQPPSGPSQDVSPHGDLSGKPSTIEQWQHASMPLNDVTTSFGDNKMGPTINQKLTPMSQQGACSAQGADQMVKESREQRLEPPVLPVEPETPGVLSTSPSFPGASTAHHATFDEIVQEPLQMRAPIQDSHTPPAKRAIPDGHEIDDDLKLASTPDGETLESTKAKHDPDAAHEDVHHANLSIDDVDKDTSRETKIAFRRMKVSDSTPPGAKPMYTQRPALIPSRHAKAEDAGDRGIISGKTLPEQQKMLERKTGISGEQSPDPLKATPSKQAAAESVHDATSSMINSPDIRATSKKFGGTFDGAKDPGFTLPEVRSLDAQDAQRTNGESTAPTGDEWKESEFKTPKVQPTDSQDNIREEKTSSIYRKKPSVAHSRAQAQTMPTGEKADFSTPKHEQAFYAPYNFDKELSAYAPSRSKTPDDHSANDQKLAAPLLSKELASQVQPPSEPSKDLSTKPSTINQWQRASAPLDDVSSTSDDKKMAMSTIDQKPTPRNQQGTLSAEGANQMAKESSEWREEPPIPIGAKLSDVRSAPPSHPGASVVDHATMKDKFAKQSTIDERVGEPISMEAPSSGAHPVSGGQIGDSELVITPDGQILEATNAIHDPATVRKDVHDANLLTGDVAKDTFQGMRVADSTPYSVKPIYTQQPALTPSKPAEEARDEGKQSSKAIPGQQTMMERETGKSGGQLSDHRPSGQAAPEDARGATGGTVQSPNILGTTKKPRGTFEESKTPGSTLPNVQSFGSRDVQYTNGESITPTSDERKDVSTRPQRSVQDVFQPSKVSGTDQKDLGSSSLERKDAKHAETIVAEKKIFSTERLREMPKESESTTLKAQPSDFGGSIKEEKTSSIYQKRPLAAQDSQEQAQIIPASEKADGSTLKHQQSSDAPYTLDEKFSSSAPEKADICDDPRKEASYRKDTTANQKVAPPLLSQKPTSHVLPPSVHSKQLPLSAMQRNEVIGDSAPETLQSSSMRPGKGDHATATPDQVKGTPTTLDQQEILSTPIRSVPPSLDNQRPPEKAQEDAPSDDSGEFASRPPSDIQDKPPVVVRASAPAAQHGAATDKALDKQKFVPSGQDSVHPKQPSVSPEQRNGGIGDSAPSAQWISSAKPRKGDVASAPDQAKDSQITPGQPDILPPVRSISRSSDIQRPSGKVHDDVHADDLGEAKRIVQASAPDTQDDTVPDETSPNEKKIRLSEPTSFTELRNGEIRDSAPSTHLASSTETRKENATMAAAPDQEKDLQTTLDQPDILSMPIKLASSFPDTHRLSQKAREDASADDLRQASAKPSALVREVRPSTVVRTSPPVTQHGAARDETLDKQNFVSLGQDSVHSTLPMNGEIGVSGPSTQQISPTRPRKADVAASAPDQAKDTQITLGRQDILPPVTLVSSSSDTQLPSGKVHEDLHDAGDDSGEAKPIAQGSAPDTQEAKKFLPSGQISSAEPKNKEIRDSAPLTRLISSTDTRKEDSIIAAPDQDKDSQTTLDRQDMLSAPVRSASPSSDTQSPSEKARADAPAHELGNDASKSLALDREVRPPTVVPASSPATLHGAAPDETDHNEKKIDPSGQDLAQPLQPSFSSEPTKEDTIVMAADQTKDPQTIIHQQNITRAIETAKTPLLGTKDASRKIQESTSDDINESVPGEKQVSLGQRDLHRREGHATKPYGITIDEKTPTSPSSKTYSLESGSDLTQARTDVHPSISKGTTAASFHEHGVETRPPLATQSISLDASSKGKLTGQEAKATVAAASETQPGSTQAQNETAPIEQNFAVSDEESAHASKSLSAAGPRKRETYVSGPTDQTNVLQTTLGNQATRQTPDAREVLSKFQESSHDNDHIRNLPSPLNQEQASHAQPASEGPTSEVHSGFVDKKTTLPSSHTKTSYTRPDSTPITGDAHLTNADMPAANTSQNQEAQSTAATQAPTTQALQGSASFQNVHADSFENMETPRKHSKDEVMTPVTSSAADSDAPNSEPGTATVQSQQKAAFDLSGGEKTTTTQDDQAKTLLNGDLSSNQPVRPSESTDFKGTNSEQKLDGASTYDKSKAQHQNDQSDTPSKGNNKEDNDAIISDLSTPYRELQKQSSWPRESMKSAGESEHQKQADQAIVQSPDNNLKQMKQTKTHDTETGKPEERGPKENTNRTDNKVSRVEALDSSGKQTPGVQLQGEDTKSASNSTDDALDNIRTRSNSEESLRSSEESKVQQQPGGKTQGGETEPPRSDTLRERSLPENSSQNYSSQSQAEASGKTSEILSPGIQDKSKSSSGLDGPTEGTRSGDAEDKSV